jgi:aspartokinase
VVIEIQKTVKGLLSADPRLLENPSRVKILKEVDYLIAREIT